MKKTQVKLSKGTIDVLDFGSVKIHAYQTCDPLEYECFIIQKSEKSFFIEGLLFKDNITEFTTYIKTLYTKIEGLVIAYHGGGTSFLKVYPVYSTKNADEYNHKGGGAGLVKNFISSFGDSIDGTLYKTTNFIKGDALTLAGVKMNITITREAFDIKIPEINALCTHMLGHDVHSIVAGQLHADAIIKTLNGYLKKNIAYILTSHYTIEGLDDVKTKIAYINDLKVIAAKNTSTSAFKKDVLLKYGAYRGGNYLDMSAGFFFNAK